MAVFKSFKAFRPSVENQSLIPALPYDVMNSKEAREMVKGNPLSFLHVDKAEVDLDENVDLYSQQVYDKAKENLLNLEKTGALIQDEKPCFYIYKQIMDGREQIGLVGCASIDDYENNVIKKHEFTLAKKEQDRVNHVDTCDANTGPIFLTYKNKENISNAVSTWIDSHKPVYDFVADNVSQTVWVVDDDSVISVLQQGFADIDSLYIADGHHRCASAVRVGKMRRDSNPNYTGNEEFNFFLAVAFPDEDLAIMDYNRVVRDLNGMTTDEFFAAIGEKFYIEPLASCQKPSKKHTVTMFIENKWYLLTAKEGTFDENDPVERLDVSILQNNLLDPVLGIKDPKNDSRIDFIGGIRGIGELERRVNSDMKVAFAMFPTSIDDLMSIADAGKVMPPKSTWFEPKLLSGIFVHHLS